MPTILEDGLEKLVFVQFYENSFTEYKKNDDDNTRVVSYSELQQLHVKCTGSLYNHASSFFTLIEYINNSSLL